MMATMLDKHTEEEEVAAELMSAAEIPLRACCRAAFRDSTSPLTTPSMRCIPYAYHAPHIAYPPSSYTLHALVRSDWQQ